MKRRLCRKRLDGQGEARRAREAWEGVDGCRESEVDDEQRLKAGRAD